jgi:hypothetical protein
MEKETLNSLKWLEKSTLHNSSLSCSWYRRTPSTVKNTEGFINPSCDLTVSPRDPPYLSNVSPPESLSCQRDSCPSSLPKIPCASTPSQVVSPIHSVISPSLPSYREPDDEEPSLSVVLDSYIPFIKGSIHSCPASCLSW